MIPEWIHPVLRKSIKTMLEDLESIDQAMRKVIPFPQYPLQHFQSPSILQTLNVPPTATYWIQHVSTSRRRKPRMMAILNVTPDSFSDGGNHESITAALMFTREAIAAGASIIDIGGCSTRPGADIVSLQEELKRVIPVVRALRADAAGVLLSIDTFRGEVAKAAIEAGANCINDVHAFEGSSPCPLTEDWENDEHFWTMRALAHEKVVPVVLMHSRGDPSANKT